MDERVDGFATPRRWPCSRPSCFSSMSAKDDRPAAHEERGMFLSLVLTNQHVKEAQNCVIWRKQSIESVVLSRTDFIKMRTSCATPSSLHDLHEAFVAHKLRFSFVL